MVGVARHEGFLAHEIVEFAFHTERDVAVYIHLHAQREGNVEAVAVETLVGGLETARAGHHKVLHIGEGEVARDGIFLAIHDDLATLHGINAVLAAIAYVGSKSRAQIDIEGMAAPAVAQALGKITLSSNAETMIFYFLITIQMGTTLLIKTHLGVSLLTAVRRIKVINA